MKITASALRRMGPAMALLAVMVASPHKAFPDTFVQTNLVSDIPGLAVTTDPDLVNPWGISLSSTSPFWVSDNQTGLATLYNGSGTKLGLVVTIPSPGGATGGTPTGQVFNPISGNFGGAHFLFASEDGTIAAWSGGTSASLAVDNSGSGAVYKGLAMANNGSQVLLYATDFHNGKVDVFDTSFTQVNLSGAFIDPNLPAGYAPFNIQNIGGKLFVTYALQDAAKHDDVAGPGHGFVDVFDSNGNLIQRLVSNGSLNSPWGLAVAPSGFGEFGGDLLVGNFGDGTINIFNPTSGAFLATLDDTGGNPITNPGLWGLTFGNGGNGGDTGKLYFAAGIPGPDQVEDHGLFGSIAPVPEPGTLALLGSGLAGLIGYGRRRSSRLA